MTPTPPICSGQLSRPPANNAGKAARKAFLSQHYINQAVDEIVRMEGRGGLEHGIHLTFTQQAGHFSIPSTTPETRLLNTQDFNRSEARQLNAQDTFSRSNEDYKVDIDLVPPPHITKNGYKAEYLKKYYRIELGSTIRKVKKREVRMRDRMPKESGEEMKKEKEYGCGEGEVGGEEPMMMMRSQ